MNRDQAIEDGDAFQDHDPTPRASDEPWRFTPSLMDPNSFSFNNFANAPPGYYTPTPGGTNTLFHPQAGDLHTPVGMSGPSLGTPLSMPASNNPIASGAGVVDMAGFQALPPHQMHHFNPFVQAPPPQAPYVPSSFVHQDTGYETMEHERTPLTSDPSEDRMTSMDSAFQTGASMMNFPPRQMAGVHMGHALPASAEKFRYHSTLNAPTAMIKHADEIPVTYLNKGQAYSLSVVDTHSMMPLNPGTRYRTFVRVSFEDDEQRQKPSVCWSLWKEGRGQNEAHHRGGKLQAVEYVESGQPAEGDDKRTRVELETSSFDGFSVIWTPGSLGVPEVNVAVRFNFLSTDFSHSKGVKGIPVRFCTKTTLLASDPSQPAPEDPNPETCFCKVKLFRDHGAERKLSNDVAHVKKTIDKVKHQIAQAETGMKDVGKRKRASAKIKIGEPQRAGKVQKHKRTWSISSASSADGGGVGRSTLEDDLHFKLQTLQDMFTSTRPVSVLYLRGEELDDPDLHPVVLPGDLSPSSKPDTTRDAQNFQVRSGRSSNADSMVSPTPSSLSLASQPSNAAQGTQWQKIDAASTADPSRKAAEQPTKVSKMDGEGNLSGWIDALGVDPSYRPPPERRPKPVACFYVIRPSKAEPHIPEFHRAIYLTERTLKDFNQKIATKWGFDPAQIERTVHIIHDGLEVEIDDDVVRELREGQDMKLEIAEITEPVKREWEMAVDSGASGDETTQPFSRRHILRLSF